MSLEDNSFASLPTNVDPSQLPNPLEETLLQPLPQGTPAEAMAGVERIAPQSPPTDAEFFDTSPPAAEVVDPNAPIDPVDVYSQAIGDERFEDLDLENRFKVLDYIGNSMPENLEYDEQKLWTRAHARARFYARYPGPEYVSIMEQLQSGDTTPEALLGTDAVRDLMQSVVDIREPLAFEGDSGGVFDFKGTEADIFIGTKGESVGLRYLPHPTKHLFQMDTPDGPTNLEFASTDDLPKTGTEWARFINNHKGLRQSFGVDENALGDNLGGEVLNYWGRAWTGAGAESVRQMGKINFSFKNTIYETFQSKDGADFLLDWTVNDDGVIQELPEAKQAEYLAQAETEVGQYVELPIEAYDGSADRTLSNPEEVRAHAGKIHLSKINGKTLKMYGRTAEDGKFEPNAKFNALRMNADGDVDYSVQFKEGTPVGYDDLLAAHAGSINRDLTSPSAKHFRDYLDWVQSTNEVYGSSIQQGLKQEREHWLQQSANFGAQSMEILGQAAPTVAVGAATGGSGALSVAAVSAMGGASSFGGNYTETFMNVYQDEVKAGGSHADALSKAHDGAVAAAGAALPMDVGGDILALRAFSQIGRVMKKGGGNLFSTPKSRAARLAGELDKMTGSKSPAALLAATSEKVSKAIPSMLGSAASEAAGETTRAEIEDLYKHEQDGLWKNTKNGLYEGALTMGMMAQASAHAVPANLLNAGHNHLTRKRLVALQENLDKLDVTSEDLKNLKSADPVKRRNAEVKVKEQMRALSDQVDKEAKAETVAAAKEKKAKKREAKRGPAIARAWGADTQASPVVTKTDSKDQVDPETGERLAPVDSFLNPAKSSIADWNQQTDNNQLLAAIDQREDKSITKKLGYVMNDPGGVGLFRLSGMVDTPSSESTEWTGTLPDGREVNLTEDQVAAAEVIPQRSIEPMTRLSLANENEKSTRQPQPIDEQAPEQDAGDTGDSQQQPAAVPSANGDGRGDSSQGSSSQAPSGGPTQPSQSQPVVSAGEGGAGVSGIDPVGEQAAADAAADAAAGKPSVASTEPSGTPNTTETTEATQEASEAQETPPENQSLPLTETQPSTLNFNETPYEAQRRELEENAVWVESTASIGDLKDFRPAFMGATGLLPVDGVGIESTSSAEAALNTHLPNPDSLSPEIFASVPVVFASGPRGWNAKYRYSDWSGNPTFDRDSYFREAIILKRSKWLKSSLKEQARMLEHEARHAHFRRFVASIDSADPNLSQDAKDLFTEMQGSIQEMKAAVESGADLSYLPPAVQTLLKWGKYEKALNEMISYGLTETRWAKAMSKVGRDFLPLPKATADNNDSSESLWDRILGWFKRMLTSNGVPPSGAQQQVADMNHEVETLYDFISEFGGNVIKVSAARYKTQEAARAAAEKAGAGNPVGVADGKGFVAGSKVDGFDPLNPHDMDMAEDLEDSKPAMRVTMAESSTLAQDPGYAEKSSAKSWILNYEPAPYFEQGVDAAVTSYLAGARNYKDWSKAMARYDGDFNLPGLWDEIQRIVGSDAIDSYWSKDYVEDLDNNRMPKQRLKEVQLMATPTYPKLGGRNAGSINTMILKYGPDSANPYFLFDQKRDGPVWKTHTQLTKLGRQSLNELDTTIEEGKDLARNLNTTLSSVDRQFDGVRLAKVELENVYSDHLSNAYGVSPTMAHVLWKFIVRNIAQPGSNSVESISKNVDTILEKGEVSGKRRANLIKDTKAFLSSFSKIQNNNPSSVGRSSAGALSSARKDATNEGVDAGRLMFSSYVKFGFGSSTDAGVDLPAGWTTDEAMVRKAADHAINLAVVRPLTWSHEGLDPVRTGLIGSQILGDSDLSIDPVKGYTLADIHEIAEAKGGNRLRADFVKGIVSGVRLGLIEGLIGDIGVSGSEWAVMDALLLGKKATRDVQVGGLFIPEGANLFEAVVAPAFVRTLMFGQVINNPSNPQHLRPPVGLVKNLAWLERQFNETLDNEEKASMHRLEAIKQDALGTLIRPTEKETEAIRRRQWGSLRLQMFEERAGSMIALGYRRKGTTQENPTAFTDATTRENHNSKSKSPTVLVANLHKALVAGERTSQDTNFAMEPPAMEASINRPETTLEFPLETLSPLDKEVTTMLKEAIGDGLMWLSNFDEAEAIRLAGSLGIVSGSASDVGLAHEVRNMIMQRAPLTMRLSGVEMSTANYIPRLAEAFGAHEQSVAVFLKSSGAGVITMGQAVDSWRASVPSNGDAVISQAIHKFIPAAPVLIYDSAMLSQLKLGDVDLTTMEGFPGKQKNINGVGFAEVPSTDSSNLVDQVPLIFADTRRTSDSEKNSGALAGILGIHVVRAVSNADNSYLARRATKALEGLSDARDSLAASYIDLVNEIGITPHKDKASVLDVAREALMEFANQHRKADNPLATGDSSGVDASLAFETFTKGGFTVDTTQIDPEVVADTIRSIPVGTFAAEVLVNAPLRQAMMIAGIGAESPSHRVQSMGMASEAVALDYQSLADTLAGEAPAQSQESLGTTPLGEVLTQEENRAAITPPNGQELMANMIGHSFDLLVESQRAFWRSDQLSQLNYVQKDPTSRVPLVSMDQLEPSAAEQAESMGADTHESWLKENEGRFDRMTDVLSKDGQKMNGVLDQLTAQRLSEAASGLLRADYGETPSVLLDEVEAGYSEIEGVQALNSRVRDDDSASGDSLDIPAKVADPVARQQAAKDLTENALQMNLEVGALNDIQTPGLSKMTFDNTARVHLETIFEFMMRPGVSVGRATQLSTALRHTFTFSDAADDGSRIGNYRFNVAQDAWRSIKAPEITLDLVGGTRDGINIAGTHTGKKSMAQRFAHNDAIIGTLEASSPKTLSSIQDAVLLWEYGTTEKTGFVGYRANLKQLEDRFSKANEILGQDSEYAEAYVLPTLVSYLAQGSNKMLEFWAELRDGAVALEAAGGNTLDSTHRNLDLYKEAFDTVGPTLASLEAGVIDEATAEAALMALLEPRQRQWLTEIRSIFAELRPGMELAAQWTGDQQGFYEDYVPWMNARMTDELEVADDHRSIGEKVGSSRNRHSQSRLGGEGGYIIDLNGQNFIRRARGMLFSMMTTDTGMLMKDVLGSEQNGEMKHGLLSELGVPSVSSPISRDLASKGFAFTLSDHVDMAALSANLRMIFDRERSGFQSGFNEDSKRRRFMAATQQLGASFALADLDQIGKQAIPGLVAFGTRFLAGEGGAGLMQGFASSVAGLVDSSTRDDMMATMAALAPSIYDRGMDGMDELSRKLDRRMKRKADSLLTPTALKNGGIRGLSFAQNYYRIILDLTAGKPDAMVSRLAWFSEYYHKQVEAGVDPADVWKQPSAKRAYSAQIRVEEIMGQSEITRRGAAFQDTGDDFTKNMIFAAFRTFSGHQTSMAGNAQAWGAQLWNGNKNQKARAFRKLVELGLQNVIFRAMSKPIRDFLLAQSVGLVMGHDKEEKRETYIWLLENLPFERKTKPIEDWNGLANRYGFEFMADMFPVGTAIPGAGRLPSALKAASYVFSMPMLGDPIKEGIQFSAHEYGEALGSEAIEAPYKEDITNSLFGLMGYWGVVLERLKETSVVATEFLGSEEVEAEAVDYAKGFGMLFGTRGVAGRMEQELQQRFRSSNQQKGGAPYVYW